MILQAEGELLAGATVELKQRAKLTTTTDTRGCYRFDQVDFQRLRSGPRPL